MAQSSAKIKRLFNLANFYRYAQHDRFPVCPDRNLYVHNESGAMGIVSQAPQETSFNFSQFEILPIAGLPIDIFIFMDRSNKCRGFVLHSDEYHP